MAELALQLPVFIASPGDVHKERDAVEEEIRQLAAEAASDGLLLRPVRWEMDSRPALQRPQQAINELLKTAELVVVIFWSTLGSESSPGAEDSGTLEELFRATDQVMRGSSDDVLVYFRDARPPPAMRESYSRVQLFREKLQSSKRVFFWSYKTPAGLRQAFARHLRLWLDRWCVVPEICVNTLAVSSPGAPMPQAFGENRLTEVYRFFRPEQEPQLTAALGNAAVEMYQQFGPRAVQQPLHLPPNAMRAAANYVGSVDDLGRIYLMRLLGRIDVSQSPLRRQDGNVYFADEEWFSFFCAIGLLDAISANRVHAADRQPYINPVHQYLAALAEPRRREIIDTLTRWLKNTGMVTHARPIARNFAAFVLGMLHAEEAQDALIEAAELDSGTDVRVYSTMSLGRMRSRRHLGRLAALWRRETDAQLRTTIGQAVCRVVGIGQYPF